LPSLANQPQIEELTLVQDSLQQIEAILKAEAKRRTEANQITSDYIVNYLDSLEQSLSERVTGQFHALEERIASVDKTLSKVEDEFEQ